MSETTTPKPRLDLYGCPRSQLENWLESVGESRTHGRNMYRATFKQLLEQPWEEPGLSKSLRQKLQTSWRSGPQLEANEEHHSNYDRSIKFVICLEDGLKIESVLMPEKQRITLCLSSQVGCRQACVFCHTGRMGLVRNLEASEIIAQIVYANRWIATHPEWLHTNHLPQGMRVTNVVFMGMGEPLDNVDAVCNAVKIATDPYGLNIGLRRISVSTAGHLDGLEQLTQTIPSVRIALSVHSTFDAKRSKIMPINRRWPLAEVVARLKDLIRPSKASVMFQYTMIAGVNDDLEEANRLAALAQELNAKVNLIPLNDISASRLNAPSFEKIQAFRDVLHAAQIRVMVRYSKGQDIGGACGQLIVPELSKVRRATTATEAIALA